MLETVVSKLSSNSVGELLFLMLEIMMDSELLPERKVTLNHELQIWQKLPEFYLVFQSGPSILVCEWCLYVCGIVLTIKLAREQWGLEKSDEGYS